MTTTTSEFEKPTPYPPTNPPHKPRTERKPVMDELIAEVLPDDWDVEDELLICPHGHVIELDGACPDGCVSPLRDQGLI